MAWNKVTPKTNVHYGIDLSMHFFPRHSRAKIDYRRW